MSDLIDELSIPVNVAQHSLIGVEREPACAIGAITSGLRSKVVPFACSTCGLRTCKPQSIAFCTTAWFGCAGIGVWMGPQFCLIIDDRIPPEWRYDKLCFTGGYCPLD